MSRPSRLPLSRLAIVLFTLACPLTPQIENDNTPYFSLTSSQSFAPGSKPFIQMSAYGVNALRFRVYRINDPVQFMRQLGDAHQFGGSYAVPNGKLTLLERLGQWKANLRREIRRNLRAQFTEAPSQHLTGLKPSTAPANKAAYFADAPVLNPRQLVLSFLQPVVRTANRWDSRQVDIPVQDKGVFLVEAVEGNLSAYTVLTVSDLVLLTKVGREHIVYYVANRRTGEPVPNARISTFERNQTGTVAQTAADGTAVSPLSNTGGGGNDDRRVVAISGPDVAVSDIGSWSLNQGPRTVTGIVYTDRPVYRPGDTVHFRSIVRYGRSAGGYDIPNGETLRVEIQDRNGKPVYGKDLRTDSTGILHDQFVLAKDAPLGFFYLQAQSHDSSATGGSSVSGSFQVQEYKKPEYEVRTTPTVRRLLQGGSTQVTVDARYYFGEPVANATVHYSVFKSRYWFPFFYGEEDDNADEGGGPDNAQDDDTGDRQKNGEGKLDENGKLTITLPTNVSKDHTDALYRIEAGVTDKAGREISGTGYLVGTYGSFVLNLEPDRWLFEPNDTASFKIQSRDYDNKPVSAPVHLELHRYNSKTRKEGEVLRTTSATTDAEGNATATLQLPPGTGGEYELIATAPSGSRTVEARQYLWVSGGDNNNWTNDSTEGGTVQLIADKKVYAPGNTAQVMVVTGGNTNVPVLMTVEGHDVTSHAIIRAQAGGTATFTIPITKGNEPGLYVSASFLKNGKLFSGSKRLRVPPEDHKLNIQLSTDKPDYRPGQTGTYHISVKSPDGKPAQRTDLSLGVVDEAIYAIEKDNTPDLLNTFYGRDYNQVQSLDSLTYYFSGEAGTRRMQLAALRPATRLAQLKPEPIVRPKVRKYFPDTTFWADDITTDDKGEAQAHVPFPDSLTTWRATARAASVDDRYGQNTLKTVVRKNLILRLAVPRFLVEGDEVVVSATVHNYGPSEKQAKVQLQKLTGLTVLNGSNEGTLTLPQKGEGTLSWRMKATQIGNATIEAQAITNEEGDALQVELPVHSPGLKIRQPSSGSIGNTGTKSLTVSYGDDSLPGSRSLEIRLAPSIAGSLFNALDYLSSYGYGCVEQTMSSFVPDIVVRAAMHDLKLKPRLDEAELNRRIKTGLDRIAGLRHEDGGWGWWATDDSHPFMTAYVVAGLAQAKNAGIAVNATEMDGGIKWLAGYATAHKNLPPDLVSYMRYAAAMAGGGDRNALNALYTGRSSLSPEGLAYLGLSFETLRDGRAAAIATELERSATANTSEAYWTTTRDAMLDFDTDATPEATATVTKLLSRERPTSPLLGKAALWLVNHRNEGYWWNSTKQTALVIDGLTDYVKQSHDLDPNLDVKVLLNGRTVHSASFTSPNAATGTVITLSEKDLNPQGNRLELQSKGTGTLYYSVSADHYSEQPKVMNQGSVSLNIVRDRYRLVAGEGTPIVYDLQPLAGTGPVAAGDVIAVRLTVTGSDWRYLLIEDPIPAGAEWVKDENLYRLRSKPDWWSTWFTERENHDDRIALFQTFFDRGQRQYTYLLKIVNPGLFHVGPARVVPMYQPDLAATASVSTLEVK